MGTHQSHRNGAHASRAGHSNGSRAQHGRGRAETTLLESLLRLGRDMPRRLDAQMKSHPTTVLAVVGGVSFGLGALLGSRLGRLALAAAIPLVVKRLLEGELGQGLAGYAEKLADDAPGSPTGEA